MTTWLFLSLSSLFWIGHRPDYLLPVGFGPVLLLALRVASRVQVSVSGSSWQASRGKRLFDLSFAVLVLVLGAPVLLLLALVTRLTSPGPAVFKQERVGQGGVPFTMFKFRSMYINAETDTPRLSAGLTDPRITPWGRFMRRTRLDELPQFVNVLLGDMSVVGPRPERQYFIDQLIRLDPTYANLLLVKPGITSIGQIRFGYAASLPAMLRRMRYDQLYIGRESLGLDLWIVGQTVQIVLQGRGQ